MGEVNEAVADHEVEQYIQLWATSEGVILPDFKHLLETDNIRRAMGSLKLSIMVRQEMHGDPEIIDRMIRSSQVKLVQLLAGYFRILLPDPVEPEIDPDDIRDREMILGGWGEPCEIWGGDPGIGLIYD